MSRARKPKRVLVVGRNVREAEHYVREHWDELTKGDRDVQVMSADVAGQYGLRGIGKDTELIIMHRVNLLPAHRRTSLMEHLAQLDVLGVKGTWV